MHINVKKFKFVNQAQLDDLIHQREQFDEAIKKLEEQRTQHRAEYIAEQRRILIPFKPGDVILVKPLRTSGNIIRGVFHSAKPHRWNDYDTIVVVDGKKGSHPFRYHFDANDYEFTLAPDEPLKVKKKTVLSFGDENYEMTPLSGKKAKNIPRSGCGSNIIQRG